MKVFINKMKAAFAVIKASKSVVYVDNDKYVTRYVCGLSNEEIEGFADLDF